MVALKRLTMNFNRISTFPYVESLPSLKWIELGCNEIHEFPISLLQAQQLSIINLFGNNITEIPSEIAGVVHLHTLYLGCNKLENLPAELGTLTTLIELFLCGNNFTEIPEMLLLLTNLTELSLSNNKISNIPNNISELKVLKKKN